MGTVRRGKAFRLLSQLFLWVRHLAAFPENFPSFLRSAATFTLSLFLAFKMYFVRLSL